LIVFIENLSVSSFFHLLFNKIIEREKLLNIYYFDAPNYIKRTSRLFEIVFKLKIKILNFSFDDIIDDYGTNIIYKIVHKDYQYIWNQLDVINSPKIDNQINNDEKYLINYIKKTLLSGTWTSEGSEKPIRNLFLMLHVVALMTKKMHGYYK